MKDFFVSYTGADRDYATWVAEVLEKHEYSVTIQAWDFVAGENFVSKINSALIECRKLIVILSENYLKSEWCKAEWTTKYAEQIAQKETLIIPIRIEAIEVTGLLAPLVYIDIVDKTEEDAESVIVNGINGKYERLSNGYPSFYNVKHNEIDIDYYVEDTKITYIKKCKSTILIPEKNKIHNRITWFADEKIELVSLTDGVEIELLDLRDTNLNYNVAFNHMLEKNENVEFSVKAILTNRKKHFRNFFSSEIIAPIDLLSIHLNLSDVSVNKVYTQKISSSPMNVRTEPAQPHEFRSPYHWIIPKPELNFEYKIFW